MKSWQKRKWHFESTRVMSGTITKASDGSHYKYIPPGNKRGELLLGVLHGPRKDLINVLVVLGGAFKVREVVRLGEVFGLNKHFVMRGARARRMGREGKGVRER